LAAGYLPKAFMAGRIPAELKKEKKEQ